MKSIKNLTSSELYELLNNNSKTWVVSGAAGFIGSNIIEYLINNNVRHVRVLDNLSTGHYHNIIEFENNPSFEFVEGDIRDLATCQKACDKHNPNFYTAYKKRCDEYFYNAHRNEGRGIGGLFFDYCKASENMSMKNWYDFVTEVGNSFLEAYVPIVQKRKVLSYSDAQRNWQEIRRGRYVEFNLVHDKGTLFGLKTNGRIESILMSLPPHVQWVYDHHPETGSEEEKLLNILQNPIDWVNK